MLLLITGLILFLGTHSVRIYADNWRTAQISKQGEQTWQGIYSLLSLAGFALIIWGFGEARTATQILWYPPVWTKHLASLLTLISFIFIAAVYVPGTKIKAKLGHPMILGVKIWALAHLIANGSVADLVLFGSFLVWAILDFRSSRRRPKIADASSVVVSGKQDIIAIIVGTVLWAAFAFYLHGMWIGVKPFA